MSDPDDAAPPEAPDDVPTVECARCDRTWRLAYELDELQVGNRAPERFALDHKRHTGHFPDSVTPWEADCRACPDGERFLADTPARRWARCHARHTRHAVDLRSPDGGTESIRAGRD